MQSPNVTYPSYSDPRGYLLTISTTLAVCVRSKMASDTASSSCSSSSFPRKITAVCYIWGSPQSSRAASSVSYADRTSSTKRKNVYQKQHNTKVSISKHFHGIEELRNGWGRNIYISIDTGAHGRAGISRRLGILRRRA